MILYQNTLLTLDYDPSTDVLSVEWPSAEAYNLSQIQESLQTLVETIRNYDVKKLFIDASKTTIDPHLNQEKYKAILTQFAYNLTKTRLKKSARVITPDKIREAQSQALSAEIKKNVHLNISNQDFTSKAEAMAWLLA